MKNILPLLVLFMLFTACEQEELALPAPANSQQTVLVTDSSSNDLLIARGQSVINTLNMGSDYARQLWFDLGTNSIQATNDRLSWDLAFSSNTNQSYVYLNTANVASAARSTETNFAALTSDAGLSYAYDVSSGNADSLAIGDEWDTNVIWVVDRGFSPNGSRLGKWKVKLLSNTTNSYTFEFGSLQDTQARRVTFSKSPFKARIAFSLADAKTVEVEPNKNEFDLCFTQYTHLFYEPNLTPYSVNGVLLNPYRTEALEVKGRNYEGIDLAYAENQFFSNQIDLIGYDWKSFDFGTNTYQIDQSRVYLIKDATSNYYKLRFLDFYDDNGVKGATSFEFQRL